MEKELRAEQAAGKAWIGEMGGGGAEGIPPHSPPSFSEQYQCCGLLQQDLTELCARAGIISIPRVTVRPFPAGRFGSSATASPAAEGAEPHRLGEHCIQVELQNDDPRSVCGVFLRGGETEMLGVLSKCLPALGNLKTLNLWSTGLTDCMLPALGTMVASCSQSLTLEGNPLPENSFHVLMGASSTLSHLSLRNNCIDDTAAQLLGQGLSTMSSSNHSLLSLVLSFNCISDVGAGHIAEGLRWNRSLLSLSLAHNRIGDIGAQKLAEVLQPFKLRHEEVVERRRLLMEAQGQPRAVSIGRGVGAFDAAVRLSPAKQSKSTTKKKVRRWAANKGRARSVSEGAGGAPWGLLLTQLLPLCFSCSDGPLRSPTRPQPWYKGCQRGEAEHSSERHSGTLMGGHLLLWPPHPQDPSHCAQALHPAEPTHPLLEPGLHRDGHVILPGNRVLLNLNLAHNRITERGLGALLAAVEGQQQQEGAGGQQGLRRLSLHVSAGVGPVWDPLLPWDLPRGPNSSSPPTLLSIAAIALGPP
uniref:Leucine rich repeat containing 71 n=1 Tax=Gallus gallus TaxID=9031 RepID=A0A8V1AFY7_CHICK